MTISDEIGDATRSADNDATLTISGAADALRAGTTTAVELVTKSIGLADAHDAVLGIYIRRFDDEALAAATAVDEALEAGEPIGPLAGIPLGIKDIITTREAPSTAQSLVLDPAWSDGDAVVVQRLRGAGGIIAGKLTTMEFASGLPDPEKPFPIPRNPWNPDRWTGGSSSGTGNGVASGMVLGGLGTDTGGSIRIPAAFCGITGLMPTYGRVPKSGCVALGYSLDHIGPMTRSARDSAIMMNALAGFDASDATAIDEPVDDYVAALTGDLQGLRIGIDQTPPGAGVVPDAALDGLMTAAIAVLVSRGASVVDIEVPFHAESTAVLESIIGGEALAYHRPDLQTRLGDYARENRRNYAADIAVSAADYVQAQRARRVIHRALMQQFQEVDLVVSPTSWVGALAHEDLPSIGNWLRFVNTPYWDLVGSPVITVPIGFTGDGLPLAMQIAGRPFDESTVLRAADAYQSETSWHLRTPLLTSVEV